MILNELSIQETISNQEDMKNIISQWLKVCQKIFHEKGERDFYYTSELMTEELASGYTIHDWLQDSSVLQNEKAFFLTIINRGHLIKESDFPGSELIVGINEGKKCKAVGCLAAYESESYVISMDTSVLWQAQEIVGTYVSLEEDDKQIFVENCCFEEQLYLIEEKEQSRIKLLVSSGIELWEKRDILYPHLLFCNSVKGQLKETTLSLHIKMIMKRLQLLEDYFKKFDGVFDKNKVGYNCRRESETVEKNDELRKFRIFKTPYGKEEFFSWHISFAGNFPGRIYFIPDVEHGVGIVGYIGKHLPTKKFPTI